MQKYLITKFLVALICLFVASVDSAISPETLKYISEKTKEVFGKCKTETNASDDDLKIFYDPKLPSTRETKCLLACFAKDVGFAIDSNGEDLIDNYGITKKIAEEDPETYKTKVGILKSCTEEVGKDDDDCEHYGQLFACVLKKSQEAGIPMSILQ